MKVSRYIVNKKFERDGQIFQLIYTTKNGHLFALDNRTFELLLKGDLTSIEDKYIKSFFESGLLVSDADELLSLIKNNLEHERNRDELYYAIQATASCQLGCVYCGQTHGPKKYSQEDIKRVSSFIVEQLKAKKFKSLKLGFFGAEPLLALRQNLEIVKLIKLSMGDNFPIRSKMATNGIKLSYEVLNQLHLEAGLEHVDVTIDGTAKIHNERRPLKNGGKTFETIWSNLESVHTLLSDKLKINIRCNVDSYSIDDAKTLIDYISMHEWAKVMPLYFAPVHSWGNDAGKRVIEKKYLSEAILNLRIKAISQGLKIDGFLPKRTYSACMAMDFSSGVIDPNLNLFTCTEIPLVKTYQSEKHATYSGTIDNYQRNDYLNFYNQILEKKWPCYSCPLLPACGGACPKAWAEGINACPPIKHTLDQTLSYLSLHLFNGRGVENENT